MAERLRVLDEGYVLAEQVMRTHERKAGGSFDPSPLCTGCRKTPFPCRARRLAEAYVELFREVEAPR